ncbi:hypothetical protein AB205_0055750, partial [Aquarana catesbeiana]
PNNYGTTVKRTEDGYRLCDEIIACFQDRAKIEKQYALQMDEWTRKWKPLVKQRYEKTLQELNKYNPKYMEEMETVFDQSQQLEQKKIFFLKQALLSIHKHLDITNNESIMTVYSDLNQAIMAVSDQEDLKWWRNRYGPGMLMNWPQIEEWNPDVEQQIVKKKKVKEDNVKLHSVTPTDTSMNRPPVNVPGVRVRAVYDYSGQESDELSFKAGDELTKIEDEDEQGWCKGVTDRGQVGLYPANYVEVISG